MNAKNLARVSQFLGIVFFMFSDLTKERAMVMSEKEMIFWGITSIFLYMSMLFAVIATRIDEVDKKE